MIHSFIHSLSDCIERERQLRKKPIPTRFRDDKNWELHIHNFPNDTTEVVIRSQFFIFNAVFLLGFQFCFRMYCTLYFEELVKRSTMQLSIRFTVTFSWELLIRRKSKLFRTSPWYILAFLTAVGCWCTHTLAFI